MTFLSGFGLRKAIKYGSVIPSSSLTAFPKLFVVTGDTDIGAELTTRKMAVTLADGLTQVPYGAHTFNSVGGSASFTARAKFDLSSTANQGDVLGYLYYDHTATDQANRSGVYDGNCVFYLPLEEDPSGIAPQMLDWRGNYNGSLPAAAASLISAQVANGLQIDSTHGTLVLGQITQMDGAQTVTLSGIFKNLTGQQHGTFAGRDNFAMQAQNQTEGGGLFFHVGSATAVYSTVIANDTWFQVDAVFDGSQSTDAAKCRLFVNGVEQSQSSVVGSLPSSVPSSSGTLSLNSFSLGGIGDYDEAMMTVTAESSARIAYRYQDQFNNSATFTLGEEEAANRLVNSLSGQVGLKRYFEGIGGLRQSLSGECGLRVYNAGESGER